MSAGQYVQWHDLFAVVDDATITMARYDVIEAAMKEQAKAFPSGIACLVILPPGTNPPSEAVKTRVKALLTRLAPSLSCLAYVIEGTGFKAVMARAALVGMKIFLSHPYPIFVETSMEAVVAKILPHLKKGQTVASNVKPIVHAIADARAKWNAGETLRPAGSAQAR